MKTLSVIIPVYNVDKYIAQCLDSVCKQSYQDIEIIIVNDGSTDDSLKICEGVASIDPRVRVISQPNGGLSAARNSGILHSSGYYITFIDSDDYVDSRMFACMIKHMEELNADISVCPMEKIYGDEFHHHENRDDETQTLTPIEALGKLYSNEQETYVTACGKIYSRVLFNGITYPQGRINEDAFTTYKLYAKAKQIVYLRFPFYKYRQREGSIVHQPYNIKNTDALDALREMKDYVFGIDGFVRKYNVIGEYIEKVIFHYCKLDELSNVPHALMRKLREEVRLLMLCHHGLLSAREKIKFLLFLYAPVIYKGVKRIRRIM